MMTEFSFLVNYHFKSDGSYDARHNVVYSTSLAVFQQLGCVSGILCQLF